MEVTGTQRGMMQVTAPKAEVRSACLPSPSLFLQRFEEYITAQYIPETPCTQALEKDLRCDAEKW